MIAIESPDHLATLDRETLLRYVRTLGEPATVPDVELSVCIPGKPIPTNEAYAPVAFWPKGNGGRFAKRVARGLPAVTIRITSAGEAYKELITGSVLAARLQKFPDWPLHAKRWAVRITWYFATHASDIDGPNKLVLDALQGVAYSNDRQVGHLGAWKYVDRENPRLLVSVSPLGQIPMKQEALRLG